MRVLSCEQVREILNMAPLTGNAQTHALSVYTLSVYGHIDDVTKQCSCVTSNPDVLKVSQGQGYYIAYSISDTYRLT